MARGRRRTTDAVEILRRRYGKGSITVRGYKGRKRVSEMTTTYSALWSRKGRELIEIWRQQGYRVRIDFSTLK